MHFDAITNGTSVQNCIFLNIGFTNNFNGVRCIHVPVSSSLMKYLSLLYSITIPTKQNGGEYGIRTHDALLTHTFLAGRRFRPLSQLSELFDHNLPIIFSSIVPDYVTVLNFVYLEGIFNSFIIFGG